MKFSLQVLAAASMAIFASCGSSSSEKNEITDTTTNNANTATVDNTTVASTVEAPANAKTTFQTKYPTATNTRWQYYRPDMTSIDWDWTGWPVIDTSDYVASFNWDGSDYWAWYDEQGNWVGTVNQISDFTSLPAPVTNAVNTTYKGYTVTSVSRENDKNRTAYEISAENGADKVKLLVDENGKVLKKKSVPGGVKEKEKMNPKDTAM